ncbi:hypothetical protein LguiB_013297 [Lonicera macranthoides]
MIEMESRVIFRCKFGADIAIFSLNNGTTLNEMCVIIRTKFNELSSADFTVKYVLPGSEPCVLSSDEDMGFMFAFIPLVTAEHVELIVHSNEVSRVLSGRVFQCEAWKGCITHVQQRFPGGVKDFRLELGKFCIAVGFEVVFKKNDHSRVTAVCSKNVSEGCEWFVHAVLIRSDGSFVIKKLVNEHKCSGRMMGRKSKMVRSKVVASVLSDKVHSDPSFTTKEVVRNMKREYGISVPYWNAWYAKEMALREVHGDDDMSYRILVRYLELLEQTNPGTRCSLEVETESFRFNRVFIALGGCIKGFLRCRPILCLDATSIKSKFKGTLMAATAMNGDSGQRQIVSSKWSSVLCPNMECILEGYDKKTCDWIVRQANALLFEVVERGNYSINLADCSCSCERWRVIGFSCAHVFTLVKQMGLNIYDYIDPYYRADVFRECYSFPIYHVPTIDKNIEVGDNEFFARPPVTKKQPGRPRNSRFKSRGEVSNGTMMCSRCADLDSLEGVNDAR